jgi:hypothetical protein
MLLKLKQEWNDQYGLQTWSNAGYEDHKETLAVVKMAVRQALC